MNREAWQARLCVHEQEVAALTDPYLDKRSRHVKDPILDFLFEYYKFRPSQLRRWSPGIGILLKEATSVSAPALSELAFCEQGAFLDPRLLPEKRVRSIHWILTLLEKTQRSKPSFGCLGMHEWAMVYRTEDIRHEQIPLRLPPEKVAEVVESRPLICTHFDAFRFFTEQARPLNRHKLSRDTFRETEQPGCLHTNMDLYKWAYKMYPWISSDLILRAFKLARKARVVDMQASPYDMEPFGLPPVRVETEEGKREYIQKQTEIWKEAAPLRSELIDAYKQLAEYTKS